MKRIVEVAISILVAKAIYELFENFMGFNNEK